MSVQAPVQPDVAITTGDQWLPDPSGRHQFRWWGAGQWTDAVADGAVTGVDPLAAPPRPVTPTGAPVPAPASPAPTAQPAPAVGRRRPTIASVATGLGAVVAIVGAFLPWATISGVAEATISGTEDGRDGVITLILAVVVVLLGAVMFAARSRVAAVFVAIAGVLVTLVAAYDISNLTNAANPYGDIVQINVGLGLWLTLAAGIAIALGGLIGVARR